MYECVPGLQYQLLSAVTVRCSGILDHIKNYIAIRHSIMNKMQQNSVKIDCIMHMLGCDLRSVYK